MEAKIENDITPMVNGIDVVSSRIQRVSGCNILIIIDVIIIIPRLDNAS